MLHDVFDFKIESIHAGFPDCIARRQIAVDRWEELRIEFEYKSRAFVTHKHNPSEVDIIVCWKHNWSECPEQIEVIELSSMMSSIESIAEEIKAPKKLTAYNQYCREKRLEGYSFEEIAELWKRRKDKNASGKNDIQKPLSSWQKFCRDQRLRGKEFSEISKLWRERERKQ